MRYVTVAMFLSLVALTGCSGASSPPSVVPTSEPDALTASLQDWDQANQAGDAEAMHRVALSIPWHVFTECTSVLETEEGQSLASEGEEALGELESTLQSEGSLEAETVCTTMSEYIQQVRYLCRD